MNPACWSCSALVGFFAGLFFLSTSQYALAGLDKPDPDAASIDHLSQAQLLEQFSADARSLVSEPVMVLLDAAREFNLDLAELMQSGDDSPEFEAYVMARLESTTRTAERMERVSDRLLAEIDPAAAGRLFADLPTPAFAMLLFITGFDGLYHVDADDQEEGARMADLVGASQRLQARVLDLLAVRSSLLELTLTSEEVERLESEGLREFFASMFGHHSLGNQLLPVALVVLPADKALDFLESADEDARFEHLLEEMDDLISSGMVSSVIDIPPEWLRARIEAGQLRWLTMLAASDDDANLPLLIEHIDRLERAEQLQIVAQRPNPALFYLLPPAWEELALEYDCGGCTLDSEGREAMMLLGSALVNYDNPVSVDLLEQLLGFAEAHEVQELLQSLVNDLTHSAVDSFVARATELFIEHQDLELNRMLLLNVHAANPEAARRIAASRVEQWHDDSAAILARMHPRVWESCDLLAKLFFAHGHGLFDAWLELYLDVAADEALSDVPESCAFDLLYTVPGIDRPSALESLVAAWLVSDVESFWFGSLVSQINRQDATENERLRQTLLELLIDEPVWEDIPQRQRDRLMGLIPIGGSGASCQAPDDWNPEVGEDEIEVEAELPSD